MVDRDEGKYTGPNLSVPTRSSPYPTQRLSSPIDLVRTAEQIERASQSLARQTDAQLRLIHEQIRFLQEQARKILERANDDLALHHATCSFRKLPGNTYHLYRKGDESFFSMLSPDDFGGSPNHEFVGSYRLEADDRWTQTVDANGNATD